MVKISIKPNFSILKYLLNPRRQQELKAAMANVLKPAQYMGDLARQLNATHPTIHTEGGAVGVVGGAGETAAAAAGETGGRGATGEAGTAEAKDAEDTEAEAQYTSGSLLLPPVQRIRALERLEGLLDDVDNARDFHTIGSWPTLVRFLLPDQPSGVPINQ
jgi:hypothetical protein